MELMCERFAVTGSKNWGRMDNFYLIESDLDTKKRMD